MQNECESVAKRNEAGFVQYVCQACGGDYTLIGASDRLLPFIDHLIDDLCVLEHPALQNSRLVAVAMGYERWYQLPNGEVMCGLSSYVPDSKAWAKLLEKGQKILPQAKLFLIDIADWLEKALLSLESLNSINTSNLFAADQISNAVKTLSSEFEEQKDYFANFPDVLRDTGMDPKWLTTPGRQAGFIARSFAGARWGLSPSSSREMIRQAAKNPRGPALRKLKIYEERYWWEPKDEAHDEEITTNDCV